MTRLNRITAISNSFPLMCVMFVLRYGCSLGRLDPCFVMHSGLAVISVDLAEEDLTRYTIAALFVA